MHFDGADTSGLALVTRTPLVGADGRSITLTYDRPFADWQLAFAVGLPAHVVAGRALGIDGARAAKAALIAAIRSDDTVALAKIARFWDTGFDFTTLPNDRGLVVGTGPYLLTGLTAAEATLTANPGYTGDHRPRFARVELRFIADPLAAVDALRTGQVDVIAPSPSEAVAKGLLSIDNATVLSGSDGAWEHLDLRFSHSKSGGFDDPLVRQAFLKTVPRQQILDRLILPLQEEARLRSSQVFPPGMPGYASSVKRNGSSAYASVDIPGATALLARAGLSNPTVCVLFDPSSARRVAEFALMRDSAALAGFVVTDCSTPAWRQRLGADGAYDASLTSTRPTSPAATAAVAPFRSGASAGGVPVNDGRYADAAVDALADDLDVAGGQAAEVDILKKMDALLFADAYGLPLYQLPAVTAFNDHVAGVAPSPLTPALLWNIWDWAPVNPRN